jgi:cytoskeleton protein RodZ
MMKIYVILFKFSKGRVLAGEILKKKREELGISVQEAASALKIRKDYLSFIEDGTFEKLPVPVYTVGYIRAYAKYLGVDSEPIVEFYNKHLAQPESATIMPIAFSRKKVPAIYPIVAGLLVLSAAVIFFFHFERKGDHKAGLPITESESPAQRALPAGALHEAAPPAMPPETREHSLQITAKETTWLSIKFSNGKTDEALLRPGDSKSWTFSGRATLKLGNAGGVGIQFDRKDLGTPGDPGEVITLTLPEGADAGPTSP